jgi:hypothetical protein
MEMCHHGTRVGRRANVIGVSGGEAPDACGGKRHDACRN